MRQPPRTPVVTVVVPVHERRETLLPSVASVLGQTFTDFELLVTDDGSGVDFAALLAGPLQDPAWRFSGVTRTRDPRRREIGASRGARGRYIAFLNSDDVWLPEKLERQLIWIVAQPRRPRISCTGYRIVTPFHPDGEVRLARRSGVKFVTFFGVVGFRLDQRWLPKSPCSRRSGLSMNHCADWRTGIGCYAVLRGRQLRSFQRSSRLSTRGLAKIFHSRTSANLRP